MSSGSSQSCRAGHFGFQQLPGELRSRIWRLATLPSSGAVLRMRIDPASLQPRPFWSDLARATAPRRAVLATCREARGEALAILPASFELVFWNFRDERVLCAPGAAMPEHGTLHFNPDRDIVCITAWTSDLLEAIGDKGLRPMCGWAMAAECVHRQNMSRMFDMAAPTLQWMKEIKRLGVEVGSMAPESSPRPSDVPSIAKFLAAFPRLEALFVMYPPQRSGIGTGRAGLLPHRSCGENANDGEDSTEAGLGGWLRLESTAETYDAFKELLGSQLAMGSRGWGSGPAGSIPWTFIWCDQAFSALGTIWDFEAEAARRVMRLRRTLWVPDPDADWDRI